MALYANGEPLPLRNAVALVSAQTTWNTPVTPATSLGPVKGNHIKRAGNTAIRGAGSANLQARKALTSYVDWTLNWDAIQAGIKPMLVRAVRVSKALPFFTLALGYADDAGTPAKYADQIPDCKIDQFSLSLDASGDHRMVTARLSGIGAKPTGPTTLLPATFGTAPFATWEAVFTSEGSGFPLRSFDLNVAHNLQRGNRIAGSTPVSNPRGHFALTEGDEVITGSISRYVRVGVDPLADTITELDWVLTVTNADDASTLTVTLTDVALDNEDFHMDEGGLYWSADFEARTWGLA